MKMTINCEFTVFICAVCGHTTPKGRGSLWDMTQGQYEFICNKCLKDILIEAGEYGEDPNDSGGAA